MSRSETLRGVLYAGVLAWINGYICRNWLFHPTAHMQTLDGARAALARLGEGWTHAAWWPFWDAGMPFEFASAPLAPALAALVASWRHLPHDMALQTVAAAAYCAAPAALFLAAWLVSRSAEYSFFAGLFFSLLSPAQFLAPEGRFSPAGLLEPHRFLLQAYRDQTPRCLALVFLLLFVVFLVRSIERRRGEFSAGAAASLALALLASPFALLPAALAAFCLLAALGPEDRAWYGLPIAGAAAAALALASPWLPPSLWLAIAASSAAREPWTMGPFTALAAVVAGWIALARWMPQDWRGRFLARAAWLLSSVPLCAAWLGRQWLPGPEGFRMEMDAVLAVAAVFAARPWFARLPVSIRAALALTALSLAAEQVVHHRRLAKDVLYPADVAKTVEYRVTKRIEREAPGVRVLLPDRMAHWANAFTSGITQLSGSDGTATYNPMVQAARTAVYEGGDARAAVAWLKAYGVALVVAPRPGPLDALPPLWSEGEPAACRVPLRSLSLAHVVPEGALVLHPPAPAGSAELERYVAALDDEALPEAPLVWRSGSAFSVRAVTAPGQAISIQVSHHPGWRARIEGRAVEVWRDGLGLMWLRPGCTGPCTVEMQYGGGWELRLCGWLSLATLAALGWRLVRRHAR